MDAFPFSLNSQKPLPRQTKVLLLCVKNKANCLLNQTYLSNLFSEYGTPQKILIFEKNIIWKAFIEMDSVESAVKAHDALNNRPLFADGSRINIYFSDREAINFHHAKQNPGNSEFSRTDFSCAINNEPPDSEKQYNLFMRSSVKFPLSLTSGDSRNGKFHSNQEFPDANENPTNIETFSSTPVNNNPRSMEISYISPIESRRAFFQQQQQNKSYFSCEDFPDRINSGNQHCLTGQVKSNLMGFNEESMNQVKNTGQTLLNNNSSNEEISKKAKKPIRLMLSSTPFESNSHDKPPLSNTTENKRSSYTIIDAIKEEPHDKSPVEQNKEHSSFHSVDNNQTFKNPLSPKSLKLFVPLCHSFSNEDFLEGEEIQMYPEKNDEILLKNLPKKTNNGTPEMISRTPSPIPNSNIKEKVKKLAIGEFAKKANNGTPEIISRTPSPIPNSNVQENGKNLAIENFEEENFLRLLPLDGQKEAALDDQESLDSEYDNYHKFFDNLVLIEEKKSNEESKKSQELLNDSNDSRRSQKHSLGKNSINSKSKTDQDILVDKRTKQRTAIEKIEQDIQKNSDSYYKNSIKNIENLLNNNNNSNNNHNNNTNNSLNNNTYMEGRNENRHICLPPNFMTNSCGAGLGGFSDVSQNLTPINFLNISNNMLFSSPSPSSHFERFLFNSEPEHYMTASSSFPENKKSKVIYVRGLENDYITLKAIYNLFSNFGNILKIIFLKKKSVALIDFETVLNASHAKDHLNNIVFFDTAIKIFYSNYSEINLKSQDAPSEEVFIGTDDSFRFKRNKPISINPPSNVLHVSNLKKDVCKTEIICKIFSPYGTIEGVKFLVLDHYKNMCLVKYSTLEQGLVAMAYLHGKDVMGRKLQISFTRTKI